MKKLTPLGKSDFKQIIEENRYYVDKSLMVKEVVEGAHILLFARPRRFGKTLNMSMLRYFYDLEGDNTHLFQDLAVGREAGVMEKQGRHPVIFMTFKDVKKPNWKDAFDMLKSVIRDEYLRHDYLLQWDGMKPAERSDFEAVTNLTAPFRNYADSLKTLSNLLARRHNAKTVILIDEYDTPVNHAWLQGYLPKILEFMRDFLGGGLKDNSFLEKGVVTGILRVAKESIFSGLNNFTPYTVLGSDSFSDKFGFTEAEVGEMLAHYGMNGGEMEELQRWYDGYRFGEHVIYNPWSILNYVHNPGNGLQPYWVNTSDNALVQRLFFHVGANIREDLDTLLDGGSVSVALEDSLVFKNLEVRKDAVWHLLTLAGYLTSRGRRMVEGEELFTYDLAIPNRELRHVYKKTILDWLLADIGAADLDLLLESLLRGELQPFQKYLKSFALQTFSYHDTARGKAETFYHAFLLGLLARLEPLYFIRSNRESGYGRYDICLIPRPEQLPARPGIVFEIKTPEEDEGETLETALAEAKEQMNKRKYDAELQAHGVRRVLRLALAVKGKDFLLEEMGGEGGIQS